jgi:hypothetical protein
MTSDKTMMRLKPLHDSVPQKHRKKVRDELTKRAQAI